MKEQMIEKLTSEQEALMDVVVNEYETYVLGGDDSVDMDATTEGINFLYKLTNLPAPEIVVCSSPKDMIEKAELKPGETFDCIGCGYDSGWTAFYDYMERIGIKYDPEWNFTTWKNFVLKSGVFATVLYENIAYVCIRPNLVKRTEDGNLHCDNGPAIAWKDGYCEYFLNGVSVSKELAETPAVHLDPKILVTEKNAEVRREIVRKIGLERIVSALNAEIIDKEVVELKNGQKLEYEVVLLDLGDGRKRPYLKMINPSIDTVHIEGVSRECKTVKDALKFRNGTSELPVNLT